MRRGRLFCLQWILLLLRCPLYDSSCLAEAVSTSVYRGDFMSMGCGCIGVPPDIRLTNLGLYSHDAKVSFLCLNYMHFNCMMKVGPRKVILALKMPGSQPSTKMNSSSTSKILA